MSVGAAAALGQTVIVGAGISGLLCARELVARGLPVVVLEKSRGYGGRMATKYVSSSAASPGIAGADVVRYDQGAQFFTAKVWPEQALPFTPRPWR